MSSPKSAMSEDQQIWNTACELANTGEFASSFQIEMELKARGCNVDMIFGNPWARQRITNLCLEARKDKPGSTMKK
jgi:hypothetical protein